MEGWSVFGGSQAYLKMLDRGMLALEMERWELCFGLVGGRLLGKGWVAVLC